MDIQFSVHGVQGELLAMSAKSRGFANGQSIDWASYFAPMIASGVFEMQTEAAKIVNDDPSLSAEVMDRLRERYA